MPIGVSSQAAVKAYTVFGVITTFTWNGTVMNVGNTSSAAYSKPHARVSASSRSVSLIECVFNEHVVINDSVSPHLHHQRWRRVITPSEATDIIITIAFWVFFIKRFRLGNKTRPSQSTPLPGCCLALRVVDAQLRH